jgi:hypothetical protein
MDKGQLLMSQGERTRMVILSRVREKELSLSEGAEILRISYRQARRIMKRYIASGDAGLLHCGRGKPSGRQLDLEFRSQVLEICRVKYKGFGATLAAQKLAELNSLTIDRGTLRLWMLEEGLLERVRKSPAPYRKHRPRRAHFGELVQLDGSDHNWFDYASSVGLGETVEPASGSGVSFVAGERACLMNMVDDATGITHSFMNLEETTWAAMTVLRMWIALYGVPQALYVDAKNVYVTSRPRTVAEELAGIDPVTQFGRACQKLGIQIITARSPQAKGRVERNHGVYQDRFVKELFLEGICDVPGANALLPRYTKSINDKFGKQPQEAADYHRPWPVNLRYEDVFCLETVRIVGKNWVVRHDNHHYQILKQPNLPPAQSQVIVRETQDGQVRIIYSGRPLAFCQITSDAAKEQSSIAKEQREAVARRAAPVIVHRAPSPFNRQACDAKEARKRQNQWEAEQEMIASIAQSQSIQPGHGSTSRINQFDFKGTIIA